MAAEWLAPRSRRERTIMEECYRDDFEMVERQVGLFGRLARRLTRVAAH
jgi:hypothetical protein